MKRRTKRDIGLFIGVIAVIGVIAFGNSQLSRKGLAAQYDSLRQQLEEEKVTGGVDLLRWKSVRKTKGTLRGGGTFADEIKELNGKDTYMIGFMVPQEQFRDVTEFMLLPIPIECYFCAMPPSRDVLYVQLQEGKTAQIYKEPVLIRGDFTLHEGPGVKFFYSLQNATFESAEDGGDLTNRRIGLQHMLPQHERDDSQLLPGYSDTQRDNTD